MTLALYMTLVLVSYLIGSFPTAYLVVKKWAKMDVTQLGSGNIGTMNVHRATESKPLAALVLVGDMAKGAMAILMAKALLSEPLIAPVLAGAFVVLGHNYSIYMGLKGGRGLATAAGALIVFNPFILLIWLGLWMVPYLLSKTLVVGTLSATVLTPIVTYALSFTQTDVLNFTQTEQSEFTFAVVIASIVMVKHISKIKKLIEGTEPKRYWKIREEDDQAA